MKAALRINPLPVLMVLVILLFGISGCQLPFSPGPAPTTEVTLSPVERIPPAILTEVAATLYASVSTATTPSTLEPQAAAPTQTPTQVSEPTTENTAAPSPTAGKTAASPTSTAVAPSQPTSPAPAATQPGSSSVVTLAPGPYSGEPVPAQPVNPQATYYVQPVPGQPIYPQATYYPQPYPTQYAAPSGSGGFSILGVNMPSCGGATAANFLIANHSGHPFESFSLSITDLSTGTIVYGTTSGNAPFMYDDRTCTPGGVSYLLSGYSLFSGAALNAYNLKGHSLQANFVFCSLDNLNGRCYSRSTEFVAP